MKYLILTITAMVFTIAMQAQTFRFLVGAEVNTETIESSYSDNRIISPLIEGAETVVGEAERVANAIPFTDDVELGLGNWADKKRLKSISRHLITGSGQFAMEGIELLGTLRLGVSSTKRANMPSLPGLSAGGSLSGFVNVGVINNFGGVLEPIWLGNFTAWKWYECIAIGYSVGATSESMHTIKGLNSSLDAKIQINIVNDAKKKDRYLSVFAAGSRYFNRNISNSFRAGLLIDFKGK